MISGRWPAFEHHEGQCRDGEAASHRENGARPEAVEGEQCQSEQERDAEQRAAEKGQIILARVEGVALPQGNGGSARVGHLEGNGRRRSWRQGESEGVLAQNRQRLQFDAARHIQADDARAREPGGEEA